MVERTRSLLENLLVDSVEALRLLDGFFRDFFHSAADLIVDAAIFLRTLLGEPMVKLFVVYAILWLVVVCF